MHICRWPGWFVVLLTLRDSMSWRVGQKKKWLPDLEWSTKDNWFDNKIPLSNSRVLFPVAMFHSVGLPTGKLEISAIELPRDGALLLAKNGNLAVSKIFILIILLN